MNLDIVACRGWSLVSLPHTPSWRLHTFFQVIDRMYARIAEEYAAHGRRFCFDFSNLDYIESTLISLVIKSVRLTGERRNALIAPDDKCREMLSVLGIDAILTVYDSRDAWERAITAQ
jgi:anti-anti-sigma regulatory factor